MTTRQETGLNPPCPDCGRPKALNATDAMYGACPKWWAIRDPEAEADCLRYIARGPGHICTTSGCTRPGCRGEYE